MYNWRIKLALDLEKNYQAGNCGAIAVEEKEMIDLINIYIMYKIYVISGILGLRSFIIIVFLVLLTSL